MKKTFAKFIAAAAVAGVVFTAGVATARKTDPIFEMRRTLHMAFGQHNITLEAPVGMCFLDESQYLEGTLVKHLRTLSKGESSDQLMAVFADCDELAKLIKAPEIAAAAADIGGGIEPPKPEFTYTGSVTWLKPKLGRAPMELQEYLDMREPDFRDNFLNDIKSNFKKSGSKQSISLGDGLTANLFSPPPEQYELDEKARRSKAGLSLAYSVDFDMEYEKHHLRGVVGTTMLRKFPVQVSIDSNTTGKAKGRSLKHIQKTLDKLMAQISQMNP